MITCIYLYKCLYIYTHIMWLVIIGPVNQTTQKLCKINQVEHTGSLQEGSHTTGKKFVQPGTETQEMRCAVFPSTSRNTITRCIMRAALYFAQCTNSIFVQDQKKEENQASKIVDQHTFCYCSRIDRLLMHVKNKHTRCILNNTSILTVTLMSGPAC